MVFVQVNVGIINYFIGVDMKKILALCTASVISINVANASGIPVVDGANLTQNLMDYITYIEQKIELIQQTTTQADQLKNLIQQEVNQVKDMTANHLGVWNSINSQLQTIHDVASGIENIQNEYSTALQFIQENYGDSAFWEECQKSATSCSIAQNSARATNLKQQYTAMGVAEETYKLTNQSLNKVNQIASQIDSGGNLGTTTMLQKLGMVQAESAQLLANMQNTQAAMLNAVAAAEVERTTDKYNKEQKAINTNLYFYHY